MTNNDMSAIEALENEHDALEIPVISIDELILCMTETLTRESVFEAFDNAVNLPHDLHNATERMIADILGTGISAAAAIGSGTNPTDIWRRECAKVRRAMEIQFALSDLYETEN